MSQDTLWAADPAAPTSSAVAQQKVVRIERSLPPGAVKHIDGFVGRRIKAKRDNNLKRLDIYRYL
jgi:hypothetical protein